MKQRSIGLALAAVVYGLARSPSASAQQFPPFGLELPDYASIDYAEAHGSGCLPDSVSAYLSRGYESFGFRFNKFQVEAGPSIAEEDRGKSCKAELSLRASPGWTYTVSSITFRGSAELAVDVEAALLSKHWFLETSVASVETSLTGPRSGAYELTASPDEEIWAPCDGKAGPFHTDITLSASNSKAPKSEGTLNAEGMDLEIVYKLQWKTCPRA